MNSITNDGGGLATAAQHENGSASMGEQIIQDNFTGQGEVNS